MNHDTRAHQENQRCDVPPPINIGGGFGNSIHNIQEPATFGMPILFGPKYHKFREAVELIAEGSAYCVKSKEDMNTAVQKFINYPILLKDAAEVSRNYIKRNIGATEKILKGIEAFV